jgi:hypothetical protein
VVIDQPAREADQDRCQGRQPWALRHLPSCASETMAMAGTGIWRMSDEDPHKTVSGACRPRTQAQKKRFRCSTGIVPSLIPLCVRGTICCSREGGFVLEQITNAHNCSPVLR